MKDKDHFFVYLRNRTSILGLFLATCAFVTGTFLLILDMLKHSANPYMGLLIYMVVPGLIAGSLFLVAVGMIRARLRMKRSGSMHPLPVIDLGDRKTLGRILVLGVLLSIFLLVSSIATYRTYHFTESVQFCGLMCHEVMKPEYTAFGNSPHANVTCAKCHIGPGADWFVKAKLSGLYQVYST